MQQGIGAPRREDNENGQPASCVAGPEAGLYGVPTVDLAAPKDDIMYAQTLVPPGIRP
jgi:hypothetical protein